MPGAEHVTASAPPMSAERADAILVRASTDVPNASAAALAASAARASMPLLIVGPTARIRLRLARALHAAAGGTEPLRVVTALPTTEVPPRLFLDAQLDPHDVLALDAIVDDGTWLLLGIPSLDDAPRALAQTLRAPAIVAVDIDPDAAVAEARTLLSAVADPGIVRRLDDRLAALVAHEPGARNPDELRRLVARLALSGTESILPGAPRFLSPEPSIEAGAPGVTPASPPDDGDAARLEFLLAELAHELRNPLVTLKTVAEHLDELADDTELRARFAELATDAIARMDSLLDNLVDYGRLGPPSPRRCPVRDALATALSDARPALDARNLEISATASDDAACFADPEHLTFALKNVLLGIAQTAAPNGDVAIEAVMNGVVRLRFASDVDAVTLQRLLAPDQQGALYDPTYQPLPFSLARTVLAQSGGGIAVTPAGDTRTAIDIHVPVLDPAA